MDFSLPESGSDLQTLAADIAKKISTAEHVAELEAADSPIDADLWRELGAAGLLGLELTEALDGAGLGPVENVTVAEQLGAHLARVPFGPHAVAAAPVLAAHHTADDSAALLRDIATGAHVVTVALEEDLGTDPLSPTASVTTSGEGWTLDGVKVAVPYASAANSLLVNASGPEGVVVVLVDATAAGVHITPTPATGLVPLAEVEFSGVALTPADILSGGSATVADLADRARLAVAAEQAGVVRRALELTAEYAREREQFGRAIGSFQAVAQRLADGYIDAQGLSLTTTQAAWLLGEHGTAPDSVTRDEVAVAIATAKFWAAEAGHRVAHTTVHVHGGVGLDTSHPVHRYFLRAKQNEFTLGAVPVTLDDIGDVLATSPV